MRKPIAGIKEITRPVKNNTITRNSFKISNFIARLISLITKLTKLALFSDTMPAFESILSVKKPLNGAAIMFAKRKNKYTVMIKVIRNTRIDMNPVKNPGIALRKLKPNNIL